MFKLIKLGIYAFLGYVLYELYQGISSETRSMRSRSGGGQRDRETTHGGRGGMTGPGQGRPETTGEFSGISAAHRVGRGAGI